LKWACRELATVAGWEPLTHPEGALFFYYPKQVRLSATLIWFKALMLRTREFSLMPMFETL
jgi:hypothetical protein